MGEIVIRSAAAADLEPIIALLRQLCEHAHGRNEFDAGNVRGIFARMRRRPHEYKNLVACKGGAVVGFLSMVYYLSLFHKKGTALINELVVAAGHRGEGIGRALVERAMAMAREEGLDEIEVSTEKGNTAAIGFYQKAGFDGEFVLLGMEFTPDLDERARR